MLHDLRPSGVFYTIMVRSDASFLLSLAIAVFLVNAASAQEGKIAQQVSPSCVASKIGALYYQL